DGFLSTSHSKNDMNRPVTVYILSENVIIGKGGLLIINESGMDFTELGKMIKVVKEDGKDLVLPLTI
ncbi:MAG: hypothetical protein PHE11_08020, partial [Candidatus Omnitrophica bacterium]|nr:hypothetical protein [Candidatus Omnitrophota bacterium]